MTMLLHRTTNKEVVGALPKGRAFFDCGNGFSCYYVDYSREEKGIVSDECSWRLLCRKRRNVNL